MGFCPLLEVLNLSDNMLTELNCLSNFPLLKNLDLSFNQFTDINSFLKSINNLYSIRNLNFKEN